MIAALLLGACATAAGPIDLAAASNWTIGPVIGGASLSVGMPLHPTAEPGGWGFDIPQAAFPPSAHVHYVTAPYGSLAGKSRLHLKGRTDLSPCAHLVARTAQGAPALLTLYFQRRGDDWSARGPFEGYRWYYSPATIVGLGAGDFDVTAPLDGGWTAVLTSSRSTNLPAFNAALADAAEVGFVLGGGDGLGHGIYADASACTGPAKAHITVTSFTVE